MSQIDAPHRILVGRVPYERAADAPIPSDAERLGTDAEGRVVYSEPGRASSRKYVFLAHPPSLAAYVRADPPPAWGLAEVARAAFPEPLPRPEALAVLGVLVAKQVVLIDGTRLGGSRQDVAEIVASVALEPAGLVQQATRVPEWALLEAARPRQERLAAQLLETRWVRALVDPDFGYVRAIEPRDLTLTRTTTDAVDVSELLVVHSQDNSHPDVVVAVLDVRGREVRATQVAAGTDQSVAHGDAVYFVPVLRRPT